jgi:hypothetical protein
MESTLVVRELNVKDMKVYLKISFDFTNPEYFNYDKVYIINSERNFVCAMQDLEENLFHQTLKFQILKKKYGKIPTLKLKYNYNEFELKTERRRKKIINNQIDVLLCCKSATIPPEYVFPDFIYHIKVSHYEHIEFQPKNINFNLKSLHIEFKDYGFNKLTTLPIGLEVLNLSMRFDNEIDFDKDITNILQFLPIGLKLLKLEIGTSPNKCYININNLPPNLKQINLNFSDNYDDYFPIMIAPIHNILPLCDYIVDYDDRFDRFTLLDIEQDSLCIKSSDNDRIIRILNNIRTIIQ